MILYKIHSETFKKLLLFTSTIYLQFFHDKALVDLRNTLSYLIEFQYLCATYCVTKIQSNGRPTTERDKRGYYVQKCSSKFNSREYVICAKRFLQCNNFIRYPLTDKMFFFYCTFIARKFLQLLSVYLSKTSILRRKY